MTTLSDLIQQIEEVLPLNLQEPWDHCGLNLGDPNADVDHILFSYDICNEVITHAINNKVDLIVSHHPFRMQADVEINYSHYEDHIIARCFQNNIALYCCHTNHDASEHSMNHHCFNSWDIQNAQPFPSDHPSGQSVGLYGELKEPWDMQSMLRKLKDHFGCPYVRLVDAGLDRFRKIGICTGSGASLIHKAVELDLDLFITGDVKYHQAIDAKRSGLSVADVGHFYSESESVLILKDLFMSKLGNKLKYSVYGDLKDAFEYL
ncbi:MAG: Nif3-like dinuclear metal center hexameric protein [Deltaproteobacteria bacterium]|nr:Nif3-like dinuclear metal center hexameric protein [Deltaproteobacteria bacterium]